MDKTLMSSIQINLINDVLLNSVVSNKQLINEILFVNENPAKIEMIKVMKVDSVVSKVKEETTYKLEHFTASIENPTKEGIINLFINKFNNFYLSSLSNQGNEETIPYYIKGIKRFFKKRDTNILIDNIGDYCDWVITSEDIVKELSKSKYFVKVEDDTSNPKLVGKIISVNNGFCLKNINIFSTNEIDKNLILIGSIDTTTCICLDEIYLNKKSNIYDISVDYLFINKGIRKLILL
jgi:hypothetical protein